jgi:hypothetical protein
MLRTSVLDAPRHYINRINAMLSAFAVANQFLNISWINIKSLVITHVSSKLREVVPLMTTTLVEIHLRPDHALEIISKIIPHKPVKEYHMPLRPLAPLTPRKLKIPYQIIKEKRQCILSHLFSQTIITTRKITLLEPSKLNLK